MLEWNEPLADWLPPMLTVMGALRRRAHMSAAHL
jgi:hypothetical protein